MDESSNIDQFGYKFISRFEMFRKCVVIYGFSVVLLLAALGHDEGEQHETSNLCAKDDIECHEKAKYRREENEKQQQDDQEVKNKKWKKYLDRIEQALNEYEDCQSTNCSCYKR